MSAPVWWALEHIDLAGGSAGEHRAELVDNFVRHFGDWWLIGTKDNASWGFEMWDQSNQYIADGETGGLATFICLICIITLCFKRIGLSRRYVERDRNQAWYIWLLGAALFSHCVAFLGISYFDQTRISWYALLAIIIAATAPLMKAALPTERLVSTGAPDLRIADARPMLPRRGTIGNLGTHEKEFGSGRAPLQRK